MDTAAKTLVDLQSMEFPQSVEQQQDVAFQTRLRRLRSRLTGDILHKYETRKRRYGATSVVPVRRGICTGCQVALCLKTRRNVDHGVTECEHCGRLLYSSSTRRRKLRLEI
jgi:predicted  nucleic acid-binding Zn-ribbon protein